MSSFDPELIFYPNPILRKKADLIEDIDKEISHLIFKMKETVVEKNGLGLAAPQFGVGAQVFVCLVVNHKGFSTSSSPNWLVCINPEIDSFSEEMILLEEGCLSIPGLSASILRPKSISVSYLDEKGARHKTRLSGWQARIFLHEFDHLQGVLYVDYLTRKASYSKTQTPSILKLMEVQKRLKQLEKDFHQNPFS